MTPNTFDIKGLTDEQVLLAREKFGENTLNYKKENTIIDAIKSLAKEPMIILLLVAAVIYFLSSFFFNTNRFVHFIVSGFKKSQCVAKTKKPNTTQL